MKIKELTESHIPYDIQEYLRSKGYKYLGRGIDQMAFLEPGTGQVLKIFGSGSDPVIRDRSGNTTRNFDNLGHEMFADWAAFCEQNSRNQFLPKFSGWETFQWGTYPNDATFLQIRMERLQKLPDDISAALADMATAIKKTSSYPDIKQKLLDVVGESDTMSREGLNQLAMFLGEKKLGMLLDTIYKLKVIADKSGWELDLHEDNFMHRNNGVPVIVDPWVA